MIYTEKINRLIKDYNRFQQATIKNLSEENNGLSEELRDMIFDRTIKNNKQIFISDANDLLSELNTGLAELEAQLMNIRGNIERIKIFLKMVPDDKEFYLDIPDFKSSNHSDYFKLINLMKQYG